MLIIRKQPLCCEGVYHDQKLPLSIFFTEYTQSVSAKLFAESKKIQKQGKVGALNDSSTVSESLKVYKKMERVEADLGEKDKQKAEKKQEK